MIQRLKNNSVSAKNKYVQCTCMLGMYFNLPNNRAGWNKHAGPQISQN